MQSKMKTITIYTTHPNLKMAKKIAFHLLKKRLIACANFFPIKSSYWWQKKIVNNQEIGAIFKTKKENWQKIKIEIKKLHPYKIPCIEKIEVEFNEEYKQWVKRETE
jgi:periplasmic divalent cation tolerance protein